MFITQVSPTPHPPSLSWNYFNKCGNTIDFRILVVRFFIITPKKQLNAKYSVYLTAKFCLNFLYIFEYYIDVVLKLSFGSVLVDYTTAWFNKFFGQTWKYTTWTIHKPMCEAYTGGVNNESPLSWIVYLSLWN